MNEARRKSTSDFIINSETEQFFSNNPFAVLAISTDATPDEIEDAKKRLLAKYHPDRFSHDPEFNSTAVEIFKLIKLAVEKIELLRESGQSYESPVRESHRPAAESERGEGLAEQIIFWIYYLDTVDSVKNLKNIIASKRVSEDELIVIMNRPDVQHKLLNRLLLVLSAYREDPDGFEKIEEFVKEFGGLGAPVDKILHDVHVGYAINNPAIWILKKNAGVQEYKRYVENWKKLGIDTNVIKPGFFQDRRDQNVEDYFKKAVEEIMSGHNFLGGKSRKKKKLQSFIDQWSQIGWVPPQEVVDLLKS